MHTHTISKFINFIQPLAKLYQVCIRRPQKRNKHLTVEKVLFKRVIDYTVEPVMNRHFRGIEKVFMHYLGCPLFHRLNSPMFSIHLCCSSWQRLFIAGFTVNELRNSCYYEVNPPRYQDTASNINFVGT